MDNNNDIERLKIAILATRRFPMLSTTYK
jgi:hypothetical protein